MLLLRASLTSINSVMNTACSKPTACTVIRPVPQVFNEIRYAENAKLANFLMQNLSN